MAEELETLQEEKEDHWISISDLMSGVMMIFLFIAVLYMATVKWDKDRIEEIAVTYKRLQNELYFDLEKEFKDDLTRWSAEIQRETLSITFKEPDVLFEAEKSDLREKFKGILTEFFPRYVSILTSEKYKNDVEEIRIEGHTSSVWLGASTPRQAYIENMKLSQERTRSVLEYVLSLGRIRNHFEWLKSKLTANGLSSSKLIFENGNENEARSRRVEFRVRTNAEKRIVQIVNKEKRP